MLALIKLELTLTKHTNININNKSNISKNKDSKTQPNTTHSKHLYSTQDIALAINAPDSNNSFDIEQLKSLLNSIPTPPPQGWDRVKILNIANVQSGGTPNRKIMEYWNGNINWIQSEVCQNCYIYESHVKEKITELGLQKSSAKILKKDSVLIALVGATIGKVGYLTFESTTNQNIAGLYPINNSVLNNKYLYFASLGLYSQFKELGGFAMANLTFIRNLQIPLPPLQEQEKLMTIIDYIENRKQILENMLPDIESKIQNILQSYL